MRRSPVNIASITLALIAWAGVFALAGFVMGAGR